MRRRDLGILILCAFAIFFSLQHEGGFSFREAWFHTLDETYPIKHEAERLPPPIVTDLNGDGRKEILVATHDAKIQILEPTYAKGDDNFMEARLKAEVSLLPEKVRVTAGRRPVAMATGVVTRHLRPGETSKEVLVVVTASWSILCFDHNLKKLWETDVREDFPHAAHHKEVSILVTNHTLKHSDSGLVIVGGSMEVQPQLHLDPFEEELVAEQEAEKHRRAAGNTDEVEDVSAGKAWDKTRHFSYYAFAGYTGQKRWSHRSEDFHRIPNIASETVPQHNYKLDASALTARHESEVECREFRESVLGVMPHRWERREDTRFELSHFRKHKRKTVKKQTGKQNSHPSLKPEEKHVPGKDLTNKVVAGLGKASEFATATKSKSRNLYMPVITNHSSFWWMPNVVVAHLSEGIEAVHLASGRTVCKLLLAAGGLHADINGDGVLDHVQAFGASGAERMVPTGMIEAVKPCWAVATSGVPVREVIFNGSICRSSPFNSFQPGDFGGRAWGRTTNTAPLEVATPILIPRKDGRHRRKGSFGDVIFLTSRGEVTSFSIKGGHGQDAKRMWQIVTGASWANHHTPSGMAVDKIVPTLAALSLRKNAEPEAILAAGEMEALILHPDGSRLATFILPGPPSAPLIISDFSGDGLNDLIVVTNGGIYGYVQSRHPGAVLFSSLVGLLIVVMAVIGITQHLNSPKGKPRVPDR
ncbi:hypothetical protein R1flu_004285 [Riccia fluitans]|uniref:FG-GAP repeat-containing protein n=1 Tax=Riccia fluitans TaxID=41844 RepID=A0ABD1YPU6_9MARC